MSRNGCNLLRFIVDGKSPSRKSVTREHASEEGKSQRCVSRPISLSYQLAKHIWMISPTNALLSTSFQLQNKDCRCGGMLPRHILGYWVVVWSMYCHTDIVKNNSRYYRSIALGKVLYSSQELP